MKLTALDIRQQEFKRSFKGYDTIEVDTFLEMVASDYEAAGQELAGLRSEMERRKAELEKYQRNDEKMREALISAQQVREELTESARKEAQLIIRDAKLQGEELLRQCRGQREAVERELDELKRQRQTFKLRLRSLIETHIRLLEGEDDRDEQPAEERPAAAEGRVLPVRQKVNVERGKG